MKVYCNNSLVNSKKYLANHVKLTSILPNRSFYSRHNKRLSRRKKLPSSNKSNLIPNYHTKYRSFSQSSIKCRQSAQDEIKWRASMMSKPWLSERRLEIKSRSCRAVLNRWIAQKQFIRNRLSRQTKECVRSKANLDREKRRLSNSRERCKGWSEMSKI